MVCKFRINQMKKIDLSNATISNLNIGLLSRLSHQGKISVFRLFILRLLTIDFIFNRINKVFILVNQFKNSQKRLNKTIRISTDSNKINKADSIESEFGYSGDVFYNELSTAHKYRSQIEKGFEAMSESKILYDDIIQTSESIIESNKIKKFLNFGISYAHTDSILAKKYPNIEFYGIERTISVKLYNDQYFSNLKNLKITYGDVFEFLNKNNFSNSVFFHSRTLLLLPEAFLIKLYSSVYQSNFEYIVGYEQYGISRTLKEPYEFSYQYKKSEPYREHMLIHNYPNILEKCGYELISFKSIKTSHSHPDYRILSFTAKRID